MKLLLYTDIDQIDDALVTQVSPYLPQQRQELIQHSKAPIRRREALVGSLLLLMGIHSTNDMPLTQYSNLTIKESLQIIDTQSLLHTAESLIRGDLHYPSLIKGTHGKPYIAGSNVPFFNISHCKKAVLLGMHSHEIGVDMEGSRKLSTTFKQRVFSGSELSTINRRKDPALALARLWTRKEAYLKMTGTGINNLDILPKLPPSGCTILTHYLHSAAVYISVALR